MKMKLTLIIIAVLLTISISSNAQAYQSINIAGLEYNTHYSYTGISVSSITLVVDSSCTYYDRAYQVKFFNSNKNDPFDGVSYKTSYEFEWYLSYKGRRVSDYYKTTIRCGKYQNVLAYPWPNEVPRGYERYVTVQFGMEPCEIKKDRRDDY